jgi:hypothetical protein
MARHALYLPKEVKELFFFYQLLALQGPIIDRKRNGSLAGRAD